MATAIVLNGPSSSGKSTVARAFQEIAPTLFLNFSIDSILYALPQSVVGRITGGADISDLPLRELVRAFYACVRQLLDLGHDLVIDHAVAARYHAELLAGAVGGHDVLLVALECPADVLAERERGRGDRRIGMALRQHALLHAWLSYDLVIDTSVVAPAEAATRIAQALAAPHGEAFARTAVRLASATPR